MKVELELVQDFPLPDTSHGRSSGIHVSSLIRCIAGEVGVLKKEYCEDMSLIDARDLNTLPIGRLLPIHAGLAWEQYYIPLLPNVANHPGEMCVDDVYMTHDGQEVCSYLIDRVKSVYYTRIHEVKHTYKSTKSVGNLDNIGYKSPFMWLTQCKAYCKGVNSLRATLHVYFPCGNYRFPITPQLRKFYLEFTREEIDDNWSLLKEYRDYRLKTMANPELLTPVSMTSWLGINNDPK